MGLLRTPDEAIAWALRQNKWAAHSCLNFVKNAYYGPDLPTQNSLDGKPFLDEAHVGWDNSEHKHTDRNPPRGALMYFAGAHPDDPGDVQLYIGDGLTRRTDVGAWGVVGTVDAWWMERVVGRKYLGWTGDILGYGDPYFGTSPAKPTLETPTQEDDDMASAVVYVEQGGKKRIMGGTNGLVFTFGSADSYATFRKNNPSVVKVSTDTMNKLYKNRSVGA